MSAVRVRAARSDDEQAWRALYAGYAAFYEQDGVDLARVWEWITDPAHEVEALVAERDGELVGLAHVRAFARPLDGSIGGWLDDLFVHPEARGTGVVDALLDGVRSLADRRGWSVVRWITADDNHRAQAVYDRVASRTAWVTYDMTVR
ncbi:GNAT family N-acetyltransferase [Aeromicrobium massiliense]|uniref:GNAT family N-acetyltransferase n=1 Tax=Aeromicrobium massiliense TaxID=1464554 RepID=UPI00031C4092|nr:GNAT family N-acetyltransferase [Aeromicrobium massiliense]